MPRARIGAIEMAWDEAGAGPRPFVLIHGFTGSRDDWADVLDDLGALGRTLAPDLRGHGDSSNPGDPAGYTFEQLVADVVGFLDAAGVERCDLLGHSMGGMVAQRLTLAHPERVASLVLMDTAPGPIGILPPAVLEAAAKIARAEGTGALIPAMRGAASRDAQRPPSMLRAEQTQGPERYWARIERKLQAMDGEAFATLGALLAHHPPLGSRLAEIRCRTRILVGAEDAPFLEPSRALAAGIPSAELVVIPDAAHSPQIENRPAWLTAIREHLEQARA